ncbi:MAG: hypothetical protein ABI700_12025 [Chloroflexota bacterium]
MRKWVLLIVVMLAFGTAPTFAQTTENESPLLRMLARIPDTSAAREYFSYIDYRALVAARPGVPEISSWEQFNTLIKSKSEESRLVLATLYGVQSGPSFFSQYLMLSEAMPKVVGFDDFTIERAVEFGNPPEQGDVLEGDFDAQAITDAHAQRDYLSSALNGLTLLCPTAGCDSGMRQNLLQRDEANPFGGNLGRSQPVLVGDRLVASSPSIFTVNAIAGAIADPSTSLADQPDFVAAAEAITASGTLIQTYFIAPSDVGSISSAFVTSRLSAEQVKTLTAQLQADFVPVPAYNLVALADVATETEQQGLIALVYTTQAQAKAAAALFPKHLQDYTSLVTQQPFSDLLSDRGVTSIEASVYPGKDRSVMLLTLHSPLASNALPADGTAPQASSLVYSLLVRAYMQRDLGWLATQF